MTHQKTEVTTGITKFPMLFFVFFGGAGRGEVENSKNLVQWSSICLEHIFVSTYVVKGALNIEVRRFGFDWNFIWNQHVFSIKLVEVCCPKSSKDRTSRSFSFGGMMFGTFLKKVFPAFSSSLEKDVMKSIVHSLSVLPLKQSPPGMICLSFLNFSQLATKPAFWSNPDVCPLEI